MEFFIGKSILIIFLNNAFSLHKNVLYISYIFLFEDSWKFFYLGILKYKKIIYKKKKKINEILC